MPLLLCHECYFWVPPRDGRCPECDHAVDSTVADPPVDTLDRMIGPALRPLGCVRLRREVLPELGTLYETAHGLYFVPHSVTRRIELVERTYAGRSLMWTLASIAFAPLILVLPFIRSRRLEAEEVPVYEPMPMDERRRQELGQLLMENPGAFFVPRDSMLRLRKRRGRWVVQRRFGSPLTFTPESDPEHFDMTMNELITHEPWQQFAHA